MSTGTRHVTLELPEDVYTRAEETAAQRGTEVASLLSSVIAVELARDQEIRDRWRRLSDSYRARLASEGKLDQPWEEVLAELRELRERVANELYP